jgi:HAMP domain-containing protein
MKIKVKILFIVVPLLTAAIILVSISSYMLAASSVTRLAVEFLNFKADQVRNYADGQWNLLVDNNVSDNQSMRDAAMSALENFSRGILRSETETIFAIDAGGKIAMQAGVAFPLEAELPALAVKYAENRREFTTIKVQGIDRVAYSFSFVPFSWQIFVTEERGVFYGSVEQIFRNSLYILAGCLLVGILLLLMMTGYLTGPIETLVRAMQDIIRSNNLDREVPVVYQDEIGELSHTFNLMLRELAGAYEQIKRYAFDAVVAQKREMKIRNVFQLYVPKDVIEEVFINPEKMLVGNNRNVSILFSDIRSFTTISERMAPDELVNSLNRYFSIMVDVIMDRNGVVDKYIGDAIMAMFGAPVSHDNDAL